MTATEELGEAIAQTNNLEKPVRQPKIAQQRAGFAGALTRDQAIMRNDLAKGPI